MFTELMAMASGGGGIEEVYNQINSLTLNTWYSTGIDVSTKKTIAMCGTNDGSGATAWAVIDNNEIVNKSNFLCDIRINNGILEFETTYRTANYQCCIYQ